MELSNDSFLALLEERISKRDGNSAKKFMTFSTEHTVFYTLRVCTLCVIRYYIFKNIGVTMKNERDYKLRRED